MYVCMYVCMYIYIYINQSLSCTYTYTYSYTVWYHIYIYILCITLQNTYKTLLMCSTVWKLKHLQPPFFFSQNAPPHCCCAERSAAPRSPSPRRCSFRSDLERCSYRSWVSRVVDSSIAKLVIILWVLETFKTWLILLLCQHYVFMSNWGQ